MWESRDEESRDVQQIEMERVGMWRDVERLEMERVGMERERESEWVSE